MITITVDIPLKKGVTVTTRWNLTQDAPCPDITGNCGRLEWRNFDGLLKQFGQPASGLKPLYSLYMDKGNPEGSTFFQLRGCNLGEIRAEIKRPPYDWFGWKVRRNETPKDSEQALLDLYVKPVILQAIEDHKEELKADAIKRLKEHVRYQINENKNRLVKLTTEMDEAIAAL